MSRGDHTRRHNLGCVYGPKPRRPRRYNRRARRIRRADRRCRRARRWRPDRQCSHWRMHRDSGRRRRFLRFLHVLGRLSATAFKQGTEMNYIEGFFGSIWSTISSGVSDQALIWTCSLIAIIAIWRMIFLANTKTCPFCYQRIRAHAVKCHHCLERLSR